MSDVIVHLIDDPREVRRRAGGWLAAHAVEANVPATLLPGELCRAEAGEASPAGWALAVADGRLLALAMHTRGRSVQLAGADAAVAARLADAGTRPVGG
jgi:hypothetical protein